jgi:hypothetical protein
MGKSETFWTAFMDGLTGEGLFGGLRLPDAPTTMFEPEPQSASSIGTHHVEPSIASDQDEDGNDFGAS